MAYGVHAVLGVEHDTRHAVREQPREERLGALRGRTVPADDRGRQLSRLGSGLGSGLGSSVRGRGQGHLPCVCTYYECTTYLLWRRAWHWSPSSTSCCAPRQSGTSVAASVACVASSMSTQGKRVRASTWLGLGLGLGPGPGPGVADPTPIPNSTTASRCRAAPTTSRTPYAGAAPTTSLPRAPSRSTTRPSTSSSAPTRPRTSTRRRRCSRCSWSPRRSSGGAQYLAL